MRERMKFVVPLTMPSTRWTFETTSDSRRTFTTGIAAQTDASKRSCTPASDAIAKRSAPSRATSCLFAETTDLPARRSSRTYPPAGSSPPITSATTCTFGSSRIDAKSVVRTPSPAAKPRSLPGSRTSARTIRSLCPVARSISSPLSSRSRLTDAPTVPYPRSATPTSTDAMRLRTEETFDARQGAKLLPDPFDLLGALRAIRAQLGEARASRLVVGEELSRELAAADLLEDALHALLRRGVDNPCPTREVAVLGDVRDRVAHVLVAALVEQVDDELQLVHALVVRNLRLI